MSSLIVDSIRKLSHAMALDRGADAWSNAGCRELDAAIAPIADYYIQHQAERALIRYEVQELGSLWAAVVFVRRVGVLLDGDEGIVWFRRGLAVASMIDANCDYRDLIVSLVLLRYFAMQAGITTDSLFDEAIDWSSDRMHGILTNARNHRDSDIQYTVTAFVPPEITNAKKQ